MRQKRAKTYRKLMSLYCMSFGFRQPYQVLADSEFCKASIMHKIDVVKQLGAVMQGDVKPMITQCCIHELYLQGKEQQAAVDLAKTFERRKCNHREAIPGDECLANVIGDSNKHRYVVASQSQQLRAKLRAIPAVPLVHITRSVMILEPPGDATLRAKTLAEQQVMMPSTSEIKQLASGSNEQDTAPPRKKRKGPKGPNPLSVKKKKTQEAKSTPTFTAKTSRGDSNATSDQSGQKRKRIEEITQATVESSGRKRKRRRKTASSVGVGQDNGGESA